MCLEQTVCPTCIFRECKPPLRDLSRADLAVQLQPVETKVERKEQTFLQRGILLVMPKDLLVSLFHSPYHWWNFNYFRTSCLKGG